MNNHNHKTFVCPVTKERLRSFEDVENRRWFLGMDILTGLYGSSSKQGWAYNVLKNNESQSIARSYLNLGRGGPVRLVSESGLYRMVMRSDKAAAKPFQDWVCETVLPAIRKDGIYITGEEKLSAEDLDGDKLVQIVMERLQGKRSRYALEAVHKAKQVEHLNSEIDGLNKKVDKIDTQIASTKQLELSL